MPFYLERGHKHDSKKFVLQGVEFVLDDDTRTKSRLRMGGSVATTMNLLRIERECMSITVYFSIYLSLSTNRRQSFRPQGEVGSSSSWLQMQSAWVSSALECIGGLGACLTLYGTSRTRRHKCFKNL